jgi:hypothetical protein
VTAPFALAALLLALPADVPAGVRPEATPAALESKATAEDRLPSFVASIEVLQGEKGERVALFDDGTIAQAVRVGDGPAVVQKKRISPEEKAVLSRVIAEALSSGASSRTAPTLLVDQSRRRITIEIARPEGGSARFEFGDLSQISLPLGRARGALEDLFDRFREPRANESGITWDAAAVKEGDLVRRRRDGMLFNVVRSDTFSPFLELEESGRRLERMKVSRREFPRHFEEPAREPPDEPR